jgi:hypothetical protein
VTKVAGALVASQAFLPRRFTEALARRMGAEDTFTTEVDHAARQAYEERVRSN